MTNAKANRVRRSHRVRRRLRRVSEHRPRLSVFRSNKHIYAQIIDDERGVTLAAASTLDGDARSSADDSGKLAAAVRVGELIATRAKAAGVATVVFDRGSYIYHGRVKALAEAARAGGLTF
jgi:large subunit ribosomal protein L18